MVALRSKSHNVYKAPEKTHGKKMLDQCVIVLIIKAFVTPSKKLTR